MSMLSQCPNQGQIHKHSTQTQPAWIYTEGSKSLRPLEIFFLNKLYDQQFKRKFELSFLVLLIWNYHVIQHNLGMIQMQNINKNEKT